MTTIKTLPTSKVKAIAVQVPDTESETEQVNELIKDHYSNYQYIGMSSNLTEKNCELLVRQSTGWFDRYEDYVRGGFRFWTARESFQSLLSSIGASEDDLILVENIDNK